MTNPTNPTRQALLDVWQKHLYSEFAVKDVDMALSTMTEDPYVLCVPVGRGGYGVEGVRRFYGQEFFVGMPADIQMHTIAQTIADDALIDESVISFTYDVPMAWMLPGIPPNGRKLEFGMVGVIGFRDGKIASERLYWDQASVLVQLGILDAKTPAVCGAEAAQLLLDPARLARS